jgi:hypothetical protein
MGNDAQIVIGADVSAVERAAAVAIDSWRGAGSSITSALGGVARSLADVALQSGKVNFASQHEQVKQFESSTAHMAVAMGRNFDSVRSGIEATGISIGKQPQAVTNWIQEVGKLTYSFGGASESIKGMAGLAAETGRSVEDYRGLAVVLGTVGHVAGDTTGAVGMLAAQADKFGVQGGVAAFADQIESLGDTLSNFSIKSEQDFLKVTAAAAALGKGLDPINAKKAQQSIFGQIASDPVGWSRYLGKDILDKETGLVKDPAKVAAEIQDKLKREHGHDLGLRIAREKFGAVAGTRFYNADLAGAAATGAGLEQSKAPQGALAEFLGSDAGKRDVASATLATSARDLMGSSTLLGKAADALHHFAASNPIASTLGSTVAGGTVSSIMTTLGSNMGGLNTSVSSATKSMGNLGTATSLAAAAFAGWQIGTALDKQFGISDALSGTGKHSRVKEDSDKADVEADREVKRRTAETRERIARGKQLVGVGGLTAEEAVAGRGAAQAASGEAMAGGGENAVHAMMEILRGQGKDEALAEKIARAMVDAMAAQTFTIVNATETPIAVTNKTKRTPAAGKHPDAH